MIIKGANAIKGIRSLNTRPGPVTESSGLLKLHRLAAEKENLLKKLAWIQMQKSQTEKRLFEIAHAMHAIDKTVKERTELTSTSRSGFRNTLLKY